MTTTSSTLKVPGATLYYEILGSGPLLLIIPGGPQDPGVFSRLSLALADRYTIVAFDPRGNSRSPFDGAPQPLQVEVQADDAAALIKALGGGPVYVFGTSGGAQIALDLATRHPELVRAVLAHEPPTMMLLDDPDEALAADQLIYDTYRTDGVEAAMGMFFGMNALDDGSAPADAPPEFEMPPEDAETFARVSSNFEYWLAHGMMPLSKYVPDVAALSAGKPRIVVGLGEQSVGLPIHEMGSALASKLGATPVTFPGDHSGFESDAEAFGQVLHRALSDR